MNDLEQQKKAYERALSRSSRLETLKQSNEWDFVGEMIDEEITNYINQALSDECVADHSKYIAAKASIDALKNLKAKFVSIERQGSQAVESMERIKDAQ